ncbi:hypothetical protein EUGRSUZ_F01609 [Eucalyptus grandis]|uniref:Uncharacterized protein n=2 Tax=Eucalyptus grandis TaxID=71139 RepID=A0ACC3KFQ6_EUCGR|nr:hypothetical protein EUGRSUZ_F01609 [Eucalyptus grandis]
MCGRPTFYGIYKRKSTQRFQSIPYAVSLLSVMLLLYYGVVKKDTLLITTNGIGCVITAALSRLLMWLLTSSMLAKGNVVSLITFLAPLPTFYGIYKRKSTQRFQSIPYVVSLLSAMLLLYYGVDTLLITTNGIGCVITAAYVAAYLVYRARIIGWICMTFSLGIFVAPLCILRKVIKTRSVEFMPITLSIFLTLGAIVPNVLGFVLGGVQIVLYAIYRKNAKKVIVEPNLQLQELRKEIIDVVKLSATACLELKPVLAAQLKDILKDGVSEDEQIVEMPSQTIKA